MKFAAASLVAAFVSNGNEHHHSHHQGVTRYSSLASKLHIIVPDVAAALPADEVVVLQEAPKTMAVSGASISKLSQDVQFWWQATVGVPPAFAVSTETQTVAVGPPTNQEVGLLQQAFGAFYGAQRDPIAAESLLTQSIASWQRQPPDEQAGLYRVRGDCYMVRTSVLFVLLWIRIGIVSFVETLSILQFCFKSYPTFSSLSLSTGFGASSRCHSRLHTGHKVSTRPGWGKCRSS